MNSELLNVAAAFQGAGKGGRSSPPRGGGEYLWGSSEEDDGFQAASGEESSLRRHEQQVEAEDRAARKLQAVHRGNADRRRADLIRLTTDAQSVGGESVGSADSHVWHADHLADERRFAEDGAAAKIQAVVKGKTERKRLEIRHSSATKIQAGYRGKKDRGVVDFMRAAQDAAENLSGAESVTSQHSGVFHLEHRHDEQRRVENETERKRLEIRHSSATKIQAGYRGKKDRGVVEFLKAAQDAAENFSGAESVTSQHSGVFHLEHRHDEQRRVENAAITRVQAAVRAKREQSQFLSMKMAARVVQKVLRGRRARADLSAQHAAAATIQAVHRGNAARAEAERVLAEREEHEAAVRIQAVQRGNAVRAEIQEQHEAAVRVQAAYRGSAARAEIDQQHEAAATIQAVKRGNDARAELQGQHAAAAKVQAVFRGSAARAEIEQQHEAAAKIQAVKRGRDARAEIQEQSEAAVRVQAAYRGSAVRAELQDQHDAAARIQAVKRGNDARAEIQEQHEAAAKIQAVKRGRDSRAELQEQHDAAEKIQAAHRGNATRRQLAAEFGSSPVESAEFAGGDLGEVDEELLDDETAAARIQAAYKGRAARQELEKQNDAAGKIQAVHRGNSAREDLQRQQGAAEKIQAAHRGNAARKEVADRQEAAVKLQAAYRGSTVRGDLQEQKQAAVKVQAVFRGSAGRAEAAALAAEKEAGEQREHEAAAKIQAVKRGNDARLEIQEQHEAAVKIQAVKRGNDARLEIQEQHEAAVKIQAVKRGNDARAEIQEQHEAAAKIQAIKRGNDARAEIQEQHEAAVKIQAVKRGNDTRAEIQEQHEAAAKIQAVKRGNDLRAEIQEQHEAAAKIQAVKRGNDLRAEIQEAHEAAAKIQAVKRGNDARLEIQEQHEAAAKIQAVQRGNNARRRNNRHHRGHRGGRNRRASGRGGPAPKPVSLKEEGEQQQQGDRSDSDHGSPEDSSESDEAADEATSAAAAAAVKIQAAHRGSAARQDVSALKLVQAHEEMLGASATKLQAAYRAKTQREDVALLKLKRRQTEMEEHAAVQIQSIHRGLTVRRASAAEAADFDGAEGWKKKSADVGPQLSSREGRSEDADGDVAVVVSGGGVEQVARGGVRVGGVEPVGVGTSGGEAASVLVSSAAGTTDSRKNMVEATSEPTAEGSHQAVPQSSFAAVSPHQPRTSSASEEEEHQGSSRAQLKAKRRAEQHFLKSRQHTTGFELPVFARQGTAGVVGTAGVQRKLSPAARRARTVQFQTAANLNPPCNPGTVAPGVKRAQEGEPLFQEALPFAARDGNRRFVIYKNTLLRYASTFFRFTKTLLTPTTWRLTFRFLHSVSDLDESEFGHLNELSHQLQTDFCRQLLLYTESNEQMLDFYAPPDYCSDPGSPELIHQLTNMPWQYCLAVDIGGTRTKFKFVDTDTNEVVHIAKVNSKDIWETYDPAISLREYLSRNGLSGKFLNGLNRLIFSVPGTIDISKSVRAEEMTVVKNMPSFSDRFRGFDFKARFKPYFPLAKVSACCDNLAAAIGCAAKYPNVTNGLVLVLGTAPAVATFNRKGNEGLETGIWQSWSWFTKIPLKDPYGYAGGIKVHDNGKKFVTNDENFVKMPHKQSRIRFALDNRTWLRLQGKEPILHKKHQGNLDAASAAEVWVERLKNALKALAQKFHTLYGPPDAIFVLGGNSLQVHGKIDEIRYDNPEVALNELGEDPVASSSSHHGTTTSSKNRAVDDGNVENTSSTTSSQEEQRHLAETTPAHQNSTSKPSSTSSTTNRTTSPACGRQTTGLDVKTYVPVFTCATDAEQQDTTMIGLLQSSRFKVKQVYSQGSDPLNRGWTRGGEIYHWILRADQRRSSEGNTCSGRRLSPHAEGEFGPESLFMGEVNPNYSTTSGERIPLEEMTEVENLMGAGVRSSLRVEESEELDSGMHRACESEDEDQSCGL